MMKPLVTALLGLVVVMWNLPLSTSIQNDDPSDYNYPKALAMCQRQWRAVLKLDDLGQVVNGSIAELKELSMQGNVFRIKLYNQNSPYLLNVDNTNVRGEHVCAESIWHLSHNGTHISTEVEWLYHLLCSDGRVEVTASPYSRPPGWSISNGASYGLRLQDAEQNFGRVENNTMAMLWYVKELGPNNPVYSHFLDGTRAGGSMKGLMDMAEVGETRCVMRDRGYAFTMNNVLINRQKKEINGQSLFHISQRFSSQGLNFQETPYYWYSSWTTDGRRDNTRYFVGTTQARGHNNDFVSLDWHVDSCWRQVYSHDKDGLELDGSLDELIVMITLGHRVRLMVNNRVLEATFIRIFGQTVIAQTLEEVNRRGGSGGDRYFFNSDTLWRWTLVHTTGKIRTYLYRVTDMSYQDMREDTAAIRWMVDTRPWKRVHRWPLVDSGIRSSLDVLQEAVERGASIRFSVQQDPNDGFYFTNADNVRFDYDRNVVYAQCIRHISDGKYNNDPTDYTIQNTPFHWFLMISSDGLVSMSAWNIRDRTQKYDDVAPDGTSITWFASY